jgi:hypothetical protein
MRRRRKQGAAHQDRSDDHERDTGDEPASRETSLERVYEQAASVLVNLLDRQRHIGYRNWNSAT